MKRDQILKIVSGIFDDIYLSKTINIKNCLDLEKIVSFIEDDLEAFLQKDPAAKKNIKMFCTVILLLMQLCIIK